MLFPCLPAPTPPGPASARVGLPHLPRRRLLGAALACGCALGGPREALAAPVELHQRLLTSAPGHGQDVLLTLDACGGGFDARIPALLQRLQVPATLFVTARWLARHGEAARALVAAHPGLFELENHGAQHLPAVVGGRLYGMPGQADAEAVAREVRGGAQAIARLTGHAPRWYRGAGAAYDATGRATIAAEGQRIAGFSLNGDGGATLGAAAVAQRLARMRPGDITLAHMNHPESGTFEGLAQALPGLLQRGLRFVKLSQTVGVQDLGAGHG